ncbi:MAG: hypothetical protein HOP04_06850 [Methylophilaceae bacterium]|nr:hypothetical protein [Methylophilaceae bacterium]
MNNKRKFLIPLVALASAFITGNASANVANNVTETVTQSSSSQNENVVANNADVFKFILKTPAQSQFMAYHSSHSSHSSHASHASHSSHQSGY